MFDTMTWFNEHLIRNKLYIMYIYQYKWMETRVNQKWIYIWYLYIYIYLFLINLILFVVLHPSNIIVLIQICTNFSECTFMVTLYCCPTGRPDHQHHGSITHIVILSWPCDNQNLSCPIYSERQSWWQHSLI